MMSCNKISQTAAVSLMLLLTVTSTSAFHQQSPAFARHLPSHDASKANPMKLVSRTSSSTPTTQLSMTLEDVNTFYATYPLQAAVLTCGVKASLADCVAQIRNWSQTDRAIELKRNAAYILYGGIFIGLFCHIEYDMIFPQLFGTSHDMTTVVEEVLFDNFVSAPLLWLPPAYFIKAFMFDYPMQEGLERYFTDIREGLLLKYWAVWLPAQTISFSVVPDHMRIVFMACISFGWFILLSSQQSKTDEIAADALVLEEELVAREERATPIAVGETP